MNSRLEQITEKYKLDIQEPKKEYTIVDMTKAVYSAGKQYLSRELHQTGENIADYVIGIKNDQHKVKLEDAYLITLDAKLTSDIERFEEVARKQYDCESSYMVPEVDERVMKRTMRRYGGIIKKLDSMLKPYIDSDTKPVITPEAAKKLLALVAGYTIDQKTKENKI